MPFTNPPSEGSFAERLAWLLQGRKPTTWARELGMGGGTVSKLSGPDASPPAADNLVRICRAENVSLSWLLDGKGEPFHVTRTCSLEETLQVLDDELQDPGWKVVQVYDGHGAALVLHQQVQVEAAGEKPYQYTAVNLIVGPFGQSVFHLLEERRISPRYAIVSQEALREIHAGRVGTWRLFGGEKVRGLIDLQTPAVLALMVAEPPRPSYGEYPPIMTLWPRMTDEERNALRILLTPFLEQIDRRKS